jgi:hypothetical protein
LSIEGRALHDDQLKSRHHNLIRIVLRVGGPIVLLVGLLFVTVAMFSLFASADTFGPPRFFWCGFVGLPLMFVGGVMCQFGYLADVAHFVSAETSPVAKDTANYLGEGVQPGAKAVAKAIAEGVLEAEREHRADS